MGVNAWLHAARHDERGQMAVELMVVLPVVVALVIVLVDCMVFLGDCARFDRVCCEAVRVHAASPDSSSYGTSSTLDAIRSSIEESMGRSERLACAVSCDGAVAAAAGGSTLSFVPQPVVYTCTLEFTPWPLGSGAFGVSPHALSHEKRCVVDPYRPGVVA
ncbi:MAG: hypothetical protein ACI364_06930 [Coriobacteriales bacterium]